MKNHSFFLLILLIVGLTSCNKTVVEYDGGYEGTWISDAKLLSGYVEYTSNELVFSGKKGTYRVTCKDSCAPILCNCITTIEGRADMNTNGTLIRIQSNQALTLSVQQGPFQDANGKWRMQVENQFYTRK